MQGYPLFTHAKTKHFTHINIQYIVTMPKLQSYIPYHENGHKNSSIKLNTQNPNFPYLERDLYETSTLNHRAQQLKN